MVYADTDFFLAMAKKDDWLKSGAEALYEQHKGKIETSIATVIELAHVCKNRRLDPAIMLGSLFQIATVDGMTIEEGMQAVHYIKDEGVAVFDAFHAVLSRNRPVISSDSVYERLGVTRMPLKP